MSSTSRSISVGSAALNLLLCVVCVKSDTIIYGHEGQNVTLPCQYDSHYHGLLSICWGTGDIPNMGCNNNILTSDGNKVISRVSERYQLLGNLTRGDVSMTIFKVKNFDSGKYFCRIHVPGWFNDQKHGFRLFIRTEPNPTFESFTHDPSSTYSQTQDDLETISVVYTDGTPQSSESERPALSQHPGVLVAAALLLITGLLAFIVMATLLITKRLKKSRQDFHVIQTSDNAVVYSNTGSSVGLFSREMAVENIYHLDDTSIYEEYSP